MAVTKEQPTVKAQVFFPSPDRNEGGRTGGHKAKRIYEYEVGEALLGRRKGMGVAERRLRTAGRSRNAGKIGKGLLKEKHTHTHKEN